MMSPFLTFDIKGMHRKRAAFVFNNITIYHQGMYNFKRELGKMWTSTTHEKTHPINSFFTSKDISKISNKYNK